MNQPIEPRKRAFPDRRILVLLALVALLGMGGGALLMRSERTEGGGGSVFSRNRLGPAGSYEDYPTEDRILLPGEPGASAVGAGSGGPIEVSGNRGVRRVPGSMTAMPGRPAVPREEEEAVLASAGPRRKISPSNFFGYGIGGPHSRTSASQAADSGRSRTLDAETAGGAARGRSGARLIARAGGTGGRAPGSGQRVAGTMSGTRSPGGVGTQNPAASPAGSGQKGDIAPPPNPAEQRKGEGPPNVKPLGSIPDVDRGQFVKGVIVSADATDKMSVSAGNAVTWTIRNLPAGDTLACYEVYNHPNVSNTRGSCVPSTRQGFFPFQGNNDWRYLGGGKWSGKFEYGNGSMWGAPGIEVNSYFLNARDGTWGVAHMLVVP